MDQVRHQNGTSTQELGTNYVHQNGTTTKELRTKLRQLKWDISQRVEDKATSTKMGR